MDGMIRTLSRWLTAETWHVDRAEARLRKHGAWRADYVPKGFILKVSAWQLSTRPGCSANVRTYAGLLEVRLLADGSRTSIFFSTTICTGLRYLR